MSLEQTQRPAEQSPGTIDELVPDPAGLPEMCSAELFPAVLASYVADHAPRMFAVVQEYGTRADARIAAWGIAHEGRYDVVAPEGTVCLGGRRPEDVLRFFHFRDRISAHLVWHDPSAATPDEPD